MEKNLPWKHNPAGDPDYLWHSYVNEAGIMTYAVPFEAPNDIPADETPGAEQFHYMNLKLFGTKEFRVYWVESTDRKLAFDQKKWLDAEAKRIERRKKHEFPAAEIRLRDDDGNRREKKDFREPYRFPQTEHQAIILAELEDVRKYIEERQPRWWRALYLKNMWGADAQEIADELNVTASRVYEIVAAAEKLAREYREKNKEGQNNGLHADYSATVHRFSYDRRGEDQRR